MTAYFDFLRIDASNLIFRNWKNRITLYTQKSTTTHTRIHDNFFHPSINEHHTFLRTYWILPDYRGQKQWHTVWRGNIKTISTLQRIMGGKYAKTDSTLYKMENRKDATKIAQLRTGHCRLNNYLYRFDNKNSSYCQCGYEKETVKYYLLEYRNYKEQRKKLRRKIGAEKMWMIRLLEDLKLIKYALKYIHATDRLE